MDFSLNEETTLLQNYAERFLREKCTSSHLREMAKDQKGYSETIWKEIAELGWLGLIYDEKYGGTGGTFFDLFILFEEMGKALLPSPFFCSAVLSGMIIDETGDDDVKDKYLPDIISGEKILTLALLDESGRMDYSQPKLKGKAGQGSSFELNGVRTLVPYAHVGDGIIVCANAEGNMGEGPTLFMVNGEENGLDILELDTIADEKCFAINFDRIDLPSSSVLGTPGKGDRYIESILPKATICKCGEMLGGLGRVLDMTVSYVKERYQFGKPLGTLQAVQHYCADMSTYLETTKLITYQAASFLSEGIPCDKEVSMAKAWCSDSYKDATWMAHQIHGGIGFTEEHDLHLYYKHAKASELSFGDSWCHRQKVAGEMGM
jgi:alkylation response protein AidB-like acyl-CoA dehydrogenase